MLFHIQNEDIRKHSVEENDLQRLQKLIYLKLFTDCFMKISVHSSEGSDEWREIFMKKSVNKSR